MRIPRFSRLFGSTRKISRSPCQANKPNEDKLRSKSSKHKHGKLAVVQPVPVEPSNKKTPSTLGSSGNKSIELISSKKTKQNSCKDSKNVKGTLSSEHLCEERRKQPRSRNIFRGLKRTKNQGVNLVSPPSHQPTIYTIPKFNQPTTNMVVSGYDSGIDVTGGCVGRRVRGKGASVDGVSVAMGRRVSRTQCRSSGYESIGLESERDSLDSCQGALNSQVNIPSSTSEPISVTKQRNNPSPITIIDYDQTFVQRLDCLWRFQEIKRLKKQQEQLKGELSSAKDRINVDPKRWSYDLHTKDSGLDHTDPTFVEAFQRETEILGKRVAACQAHVVITTCFDRQPGGVEGDTGCTADCVPSWAIQDTDTLVSEL